MDKLNFNFKRNAQLPLILQDEMAECGHACIAMISNYLGHELDLFSLRKRFVPSRHGVSLLTITDMFTQLGFKTRALKVPLEELKFVKTPAVLHWNMNHFVVLKKVNKHHVIIHDPALGLKKCTWQEVSNSFTGILLEVERAEDFSVIRSKNSLTLTDLIKTTLGINKFVGFLLLLSLIIELLTLMNPLLIQYVTDNLINTGDNQFLLIGIGFLLLVIMQVFTEYIRGDMVIYLTNNLTEQFASNTVNHLLKLPLTFFEKRQKGDIQSKFQSVEMIQRKMSTDFINTVLDGLMMLINLSVMFIYSSLLASCVCVTLGLYWICRYVSYHFLKRQTESSITQHAQSSSAFLETIQGILPVKIFLKERVRFNKWRNTFIQSLNADIKIAKINMFYNVTYQFLFHVDHIVVICLGASIMSKNHFSVGMLMAFLSYRLLLINKASSFIQHIFDYKLISIQLNRLSDILFQEPENLGRDVTQQKSITGQLSIRNLAFRYEENEPYIFQRFNLDIQAGEKVAIVGPSGTGKTTLLKLMMGLINYQEGDILIDGCSLPDFGLKNYRQLTASVMQEDSLLSGSILDNIAFFDEEIDIESVYEVAKFAHIHETIMRLPMGYETLIGEMGSSLSGGQKQRLLLARALYKQPKILFLDEATSHLDTDNEAKINQSLKSLQMTQIIIAHREETIKTADRVINLALAGRLYGFCQK